MSKRFIDSELFKKPLMRGIKAPYKLLWIYFFCDCNGAGIWECDFEVAEVRLGQKTDWEEVKSVFADRIIEISSGTKWFFPEFIEFQYGQLNANNPAHKGFIKELLRYSLIDEKLNIIKAPLEGLPSTSKGTKVKVKVKVKVKEGGVGETTAPGQDKKTADNSPKHHFQKIILERFKRIGMLRDQLTCEESCQLEEKYGAEMVEKIFSQMENYAPLVKNYISVFLTTNNWCKSELEKKSGYGRKSQYGTKPGFREKLVEKLNQLEEERQVGNS